MPTKRVFLYLFLVFCSVAPSFGQSGRLVSGGGNLHSLAGLHTNVLGLNAVYANPANIGWSSIKFGVDISADRRYNLEELSTYGLGLVYKLSAKDVVHVSVAKFGDSDYSENKIALGYTRSLLANLNAGLRLNYQRYSILEGGTKGFLIPDIGLSSKINDQLLLSAYISNPLPQSFDDDINLPTILSFGVNYTPSKKIALLLEFQQMVDRPIATRVGLMYDIIAPLQLRLGADFGVQSLGFGFTYTLGNYKGTAGYRTHTAGNTSALSVQYGK